MKRTTGSSTSSARRSHCCATATAVTAFVIENQIINVSVVIGTPSRASPTATSATGSPPRETYSWAPMCVPSAIPFSNTSTTRIGRLLIRLPGEGGA